MLTVWDFLETGNQLWFVFQKSGNRLQALKEKLQVGMSKRRLAAYERRQQLYKMENEEGYEEGAADGLPEDEEEAEMTDKSETDDEDDEDEAEEVEEEEKKDWVGCISILLMWWFWVWFII